MDGDGDLDIVSASYVDDTIAWHENDGAADPSWTTIDIVTFTSPNGPDGVFDVHVADMDGDGDLDIVSASDVDDTIAWYENDGAADPSWTAVDIATSADGATDVHVADMDGDGDLDIVSALQQNDTIAWYENDGNLNTSAQAGVDYTANSGTLTIAAGSTTGTITIDLLQDSEEENTETATLTLSNPTNATISDSTGTLTITDDDSGSLTFISADIATSAKNPKGIHVADMDGDGDLDIVSASVTDSTIAWYENDGAADPTWSAADIATSADGAYDVHVADMDGDGDLDIVSASFR